MKTLTYSVPFTAVMLALRGPLLALYDDMLRGHLVTVSSENMRWLEYRRLAWWDSDDEVWRPRTVDQAKALWERDGPCLAAAARPDGGQLAVLAAAADPEPTPEPQPESAPRVHDRTPRVLELEGLSR